jgi:hypothetical protein
VIPIARTLRKFNINVAFKSRNTLGKWLKHKDASPDVANDKCEACGVYKIKCRSCQNAYIGQTGRSFKVRFKEHINDIVNNRSKTGYSQHILNNGHERAHSIMKLEVLERQHKSPFLNTLEKFHIFKCRKECNLLNDIQCDIIPYLMSSNRLALINQQNLLFLTIDRNRCHHSRTRHFDTGYWGPLPLFRS